MRDKNIKELEATLEISENFIITLQKPQKVKRWFKKHFISS